MPPKAYRTVSLTERAHERLTSLREELLRRGTGALPPGIAPENTAALTMSDVIEIAIRAAEHALRGGKK